MLAPKSIGFGGVEEDYEEISHHVSSIEKFKTDQYVTQFILRNMSDYPESRFMEILDKLIDRAYANAAQNDQNPEIFSLIMNSPILVLPILIPARDRQQNSVESIINEMDFLEVKYLGGQNPILYF